MTMDAGRFDSLTKTLSSGSDRRQMLAGLFSGTLAGLLGLTEVTAKNNKDERKKQQVKRKGGDKSTERKEGGKSAERKGGDKSSKRKGGDKSSKRRQDQARAQAQRPCIQPGGTGCSKQIR